MTRVRRRRSLCRPSTILFGIICLIITFVIIKVNSSDLTITTTLTYQLPSAVDLSHISITSDSIKWSAAVSGIPVTGSDNFSDDLQPTASTAKIILALAVMEKHPFLTTESGETITISQEFFDIYQNYYKQGGSTTPVAVGEEITEYDALSSTLIASSNNMADTLAIWAFGSLEEYQKFASSLVKNLGAEHTIIGPDASGFNPETKSTAGDLAKIGAAVLKQPVLAEIVSKKTAVIPVAGEITTTNALLGTQNIVGIKTGYIGEASGYCLISGYFQNDLPITTSVLGATTRQESFIATSTLTEQLQSTLTPMEIIPEKTEIGYLESWWTGKIPLYTAEQLSGVIWATPTIELKLSDYDENSQTTSGYLSISIGEQESHIAVVSGQYAAKPSFWQLLTH